MARLNRPGRRALGVPRRPAGRHHDAADQELFGFAALWDRSMREDATAVESCVHITMPANELLAEIHNTGNIPHRMPAILRAENREAWLTGTPEEARAVLRQYPPDLMDAYEVSTSVTAVKNSSPDLIEPIERVARRA